MCAMEGSVLVSCVTSTDFSLFTFSFSQMTDSEENEAACALINAIAEAQNLLDHSVSHHTLISTVGKSTAERSGSPSSNDSKMQTARKAYQRKIAGLNSLVLKAERERDDALAALSELRNRLDESDLKPSSSASLDVVATMQQEIQRVRSENQELVQLLEKEKASRKTAEQRLEQYEQALSKGCDDDQVQALRSQVSDISSERIRLEKALASKDRMIGELRQKVAAQSAEILSFEQTIDESQSKLSSAVDEVASLEKRLESKTAALEKSEFALKTLRRESLEANLKNEEELAKVSQRCAELTSQTTTLQNDHSRLQKENAALKESALRLREASAVLATKEKELLNRLSSSKRHLAAVQTAWCTSVAAAGRKQLLWRSFVALQKLLHQRKAVSLTTKIAETAKALDQKDAECRQKESDANARVQQLLDVAKESEKNTSVLRSEIAEARKSADEHTKAIESLESQKSALAENQKELQSRIAFQRERLAEYEQRISQGEKETSALEFWKTSCQQNQAALEDAKLEVQRLKEAVASQPSREDARNATPRKEQRDLADVEVQTEVHVEASSADAAVIAPREEKTEAYEVSTLRAALEADAERRNEDANVLLNGLAALENAHANAVRQWQEKNAELTRLLSTSRSDALTFETAAQKQADRSAQLERQIALQHKKAAKMLEKASSSRLRARFFILWTRNAGRRQLAATRQTAQKSLKSLQGKLENFKRVADEAVAAERQRSTTSTPSPAPSSRRDGVSTSDRITQTLLTIADVEEAVVKADRYASKSKDLSKLMETARTQLQSVVAELQAVKGRENNLLEECKQLSLELENKSKELARVKGELRKAVTAWSDSALPSEQQEFATWLLTTRSALVREIASLAIVARGGPLERRVHSIVYKFLTDPEKHHNGLSVGIYGSNAMEDG